MCSRHQPEAGADGASPPDEEARAIIEDKSHGPPVPRTDPFKEGRRAAFCAEHDDLCLAWVYKEREKGGPE